MVYSVILWAMMIYLVVGEPFIGQRMYRKLKAGQTTRMRFYPRIILLEWLFVAIVVATFLAAAIPLRLLGLYNPNGFFLAPGIIGGIVIGLVAGVVASTLIVVFQQWKNGGARSPSTEHVEALLPRTPRERALFALVAITAGICEEILYRGLPVYLLDHHFPNLGPILVVIITACVFGLAHAYQGVKGILGTGLLGGVFTAVYLSTGALWLPIICHALIDLRATLLPAPKES